MAYDATRPRGAARGEQAVPLVIPPAFDPTSLQNQINQKANASTALLTAVVTGVNALISALTNYDIFGASAVGTTFTCIAVQRSDS